MKDIRLRLTLNYIFETGCSLSNAMRKAGYSDAYCHNPQKITRTKKFQNLVDQLNLNNVHLARSLMNLTKGTTPFTDLDGEVTYYPARPMVFLRALDVILRVRGDYRH